MIQDPPKKKPIGELFEAPAPVPGAKGAVRRPIDELFQEPEIPAPDPFVQAPPQGPPTGASSTGAATSLAGVSQAGAPAGPTARIPTQAEDPAAFAFNSAALLGEDPPVQTPEQVALAVNARRLRNITAPARKQAPYVDVPQRDDMEVPSFAEQQYTPAMKAAKEEAGTWTSGDEFRFRETGLIQQRNALTRLRNDLAAKVQQQGGTTPEDEVQLAAMQQQQQLLEASYKDLLASPPKDGFDLVVEERQKVSDKEFKRAQALAKSGNYLHPEVIEEYAVKPGVNAANEFIIGGLVGGASRTLDFIGNIPAKVMGDEEYYSPFAEFADNINRGMEATSAYEAGETKGSLFDKDWNFNGDAALPQLIRTGVYMAGLMASGGYGGRAGLGAASFLSTEEDYYQEAIDAGLKPNEAQQFSILAAGATASLEGINPQLYGQGTVKGQMAQRALKALKGGSTMKEAIKDGTLFVLKEVGGENVQELSQAGSDMLARYVVNQKVGENKLDPSMTPQEAVETILLTTALSGLAAGAARGADRPLHRQALEWATQNPEAMEMFINTSVPAQQREPLLQELQRRTKIERGLPEQVQGPQRWEVASAVAEKEKIKEEQAEASVDETVASIVGNKFEERIAEQDERIANAMGVTTDDLAKKAETDRLREQYDKAKLKSDITGQPMPEGSKRPAEFKLEPTVNEDATTSVQPTGEEVRQTSLLPDPQAQQQVGIPASETTGLGPEPVLAEGAVTPEAAPIQTPQQDVQERQAQVPSIEEGDLRPLPADTGMGGRMVGDHDGSGREAGDMDGSRKIQDTIGARSTIPVQQQVGEATEDQSQVTDEDQPTEQATQATDTGAAPDLPEQPPAPPEPAAPVAKPKKPKGFKVKREPVEKAVFTETDIIAPGVKQGTQKEVVIPGYEEYRFGVGRVEGGYQVYELESRAITGGKPQGTVNLAVADARERFAKYGKPKLDEVIGGAINERKSLADKIRGLKIGNKGITGAFIIPPQVIDAALEVVATAVEAGEAATSAIKKGLKALKETDWYKGLTGVEKKEAERQFSEPLEALSTPEDKKPKTGTRAQKKAMDAAGKRPSKKVTVEEMTALRDQIRAEARAARGAAAYAKKERGAFAERVAEAIKPLRAKLSPAQVSSLMNRANKVDATNPMQVARFLNYADRVVQDANYAKGLADAKAARKKAKTQARNKKNPLNHREALQMVADVDVSLIKDPEEYAEVVGRYLSGLASVTAKRYDPARTKELMDLSERLYKQVDAAYRKLLMEEHGVEATDGLSAQELYEALEAEDVDRFADNLSQAKRTELEDRVRDMASYRKLALDEYTNEDLSAPQKKMLGALKGADIERMNLDQQASYVKAVDNIILNDSFNGAGYVAAIAEATRQAPEAIELVKGKPVRTLFSPSLARTFMSLSDAFRFFHGMGPTAAAVQNRIGLGDFVRGKKEWSGQTKELGKKMTDFYNGLHKKYKNLYNEGLMLAEGMTAFAIQSIPGYDTQKSFELRKAMIQQDIAEKMDSRGQIKREAEVGSIVYTELLKDAKTPDELLSTLKVKYPAARESLDFLMELPKPYRDRIQENAADTWNEGGDYDDPNYIPIRFRGTPSMGTTLDPQQPRNISNKSLKPKQARGTLARQSYQRLPKDRWIDYNVRHNTYSSLSDDLYDVYTSRPQMRINEFMKMPDATKVFGSRENVGHMKDMLQKYLRAQYEYQDDESKLVNKVVNSARSWATARALGGFTQVFKQLPEAVVQASVVMKGRADLIFKNMAHIQDGAALLNKYAIGDRAGIQGGSKWEGRVKQHTSQLEAAIRNRNIDKAAAAAQDIGKIWMASLAAGDSMAAKASWLGLYEQERLRQGHRVTSWEQEALMHDTDQQRQDAALYAESLIDQVMVSSDPAKMASIAKKGSEGWRNLGKALFLSFSSFAMQASSRRALDLSDLYTYGKLKFQGDPAASEIEAGKAARSFLASTVGSATFAASSIWIAGAVKEAMAGLWDKLFDDDEEGKDNMVLAISIIMGMYMMGLMDADMLQATLRAQRERLKAGKRPRRGEQTNEEKGRIKNMKLFKTRFLTENIPYLNTLQFSSDKMVDFLNKLEYNTLVDNNDPSVFTQRGTPMKFEQWLKDPANTPFYRYGQGWDAGEVPLGMLDVVRQNIDRAEKQYDLLTGEADVERSRRE